MSSFLSSIILFTDNPHSKKKKKKNIEKQGEQPLNILIL